MAIGTRRHRLLTGENVGSIVRWTVANTTSRDALSLTADDNGSVALTTDDSGYYVLIDYSVPTWTQLNVQGGAAAIDIKDEGSLLTASPTEIDYVGAGVTATAVGNLVTVTIPGGGAGAGDVVGPASATNDVICVFDGTTGKLIKNSTGTIAAIDANTAKISFDSTSSTKLGTIETNADVTDTANVTSAGAVMDSEVSSLSGIKTLTVPDSPTTTTLIATLTDDTTAAAARATLDVDQAGTDNSTDQTDSTVPHDSVIGTPTKNTVAELLDVAIARIGTT